MVDIKPNDSEVLWVEPQNATDERVPTAQELRASSRLHTTNLSKVDGRGRPAGLMMRPDFACIGKSVILPQGLMAHAPGHPALAALASDVTVQLPALADVVSTISRYDYVSLLVFGVEVTGEIDPDINLDFEWQAQSGAVQTVSKENTRRVRTVWAIAVHPANTTTTDIYNALPTTANDDRTLTVDQSATGQAVGSYQLYPLDANLVSSATYTVIPDTLQLIPLLRVWRSQEHTQEGYIWGNGGEQDFDLDYHIQPSYRYVGSGWEDWESRAKETLRRLMLGKPLQDSESYDRAVYNLLNGQVGTNPDAPGVATASPNGATALANGQRVSFTNQAITQKTYCLPVVTVDAGGLAQASVPFQVNSPSGSFFSQDAEEHRVFTVTGRNVTNFGTLTGLGGTGALIWTANNTAIVTPGDRVYIVPGIFYPAGSGFPNAGQTETVYRDALPVAAANVREAAADDDLDAYITPANGEAFIVVMGRERAALHYIYKRITVTSSADGVVVIPNNERGVIAFISGTGAPSGRQDTPVLTGLSSNTSYDLLIYYPPPAVESWQFQLKVPRYKGSQESVDGALITSVCAVGHTQGGGNDTFLADGEMQYEAIAFRVPKNSTPQAIEHYQCNYRMNFTHEGAAEETSIRWIPLSPAAGYTLPKAGLTISATAANDAQGSAMPVTLGDGHSSLGALKKSIQCQQVWQLVVGMGVLLPTGDRRLLVATTNEGTPSEASPVVFSSDAPGYTGIDTFKLW